jgi:hypothetical protein
MHQPALSSTGDDEENTRFNLKRPHALRCMGCLNSVMLLLDGSAVGIQRFSAFAGQFHHLFFQGFVIFRIIVPDQKPGRNFPG